MNMMMALQNENKEQMRQQRGGEESDSIPRDAETSSCCQRAYGSRNALWEACGERNSPCSNCFGRDGGAYPECVRFQYPKGFPCMKRNSTEEPNEHFLYFHLEKLRLQQAEEKKKDRDRNLSTYDVICLDDVVNDVSRQMLMKSIGERKYMHSEVHDDEHINAERFLEACCGSNREKVAISDDRILDELQTRCANMKQKSEDTNDVKKKPGPPRKKGKRL